MRIDIGFCGSTTKSMSRPAWFISSICTFSTSFVESCPVDAAPYDSMPLFIRAGSIVPFGPELQYTGEKPADPLTLYVYAGHDGAFTLYEDDGLTYNYEKGAFARIPVKWDDRSRTLTLGKREGKFAGMLSQRTINVVLVSRQKPVGYSFNPTPDQTVTYRGKELKLTFK